MHVSSKLTYRTVNNEASHVQQNFISFTTLINSNGIGSKLLPRRFSHRSVATHKQHKDHKEPEVRHFRLTSNVRRSLHSILCLTEKVYKLAMFVMFVFMIFLNMVRQFRFCQSMIIEHFMFSESFRSDDADCQWQISFDDIVWFENSAFFYTML